MTISAFLWVLGSVKANSTELDVLSSGGVVILPFVTNRSFDRQEGAGVIYGNTLGGLSAGHCTVASVPGADDGKFMGVEGGSFEEFLEHATYAGKHIVVYFHGYYEDFERSCRRAATFKRRLSLDGELLLFSWPANSTPLTYADDVADLEASTPVFLDVLDRLGQRFGHEHISIVGHSLGTRGLVRALRDWPEDEARFRNLVLVAGDMDRERFREALPELRKHIDHITVLVSDRDLPLKLSKTLNRGSRLGQAEGGAIEGVTVLDVTEIADTHFSGHVYHLRNEAVVAMIRQALEPEADDTSKAAGTTQ